MTEAKNYRSISLLSLIQRVIEYFIQTGSRNELLCIYQSGCRASHSSDSCLSRLTGMILNGAENENNWYNFDRLIDLQTAFDTLDLKIFLDNEVRFFRSNSKVVLISPHNQLFLFYSTNYFRKQGP